MVFVLSQGFVESSQVKSGVSVGGVFFGASSDDPPPQPDKNRAVSNRASVNLNCISLLLNVGLLKHVQNLVQKNRATHNPVFLKGKFLISLSLS